MSRKTILLLAVLTVLVIVGAAPSDSTAHRTTRAQCAKSATTLVHGLRPWNQTVQRWRVAFTRCLSRSAKHQLTHACRRGKRRVVRGITVKGVPANAHQRRNITRALRVARRMHSPRSHMVGMVAGITQEATAYNRASGDGTSVGVLQLISDHGDVAWRMKVENSAGWFLRGARSIDPHGRAALSTTRYRWGLIQRVQRSGHPFAYNQWLPEANRTVAAFLGPCPA